MQKDISCHHLGVAKISTDVVWIRSPYHHNHAQNVAWYRNVYCNSKMPRKLLRVRVCVPIHRKRLAELKAEGIKFEPVAYRFKL